jgi:hypothetical protein
MIAYTPWIPLPRLQRALLRQTFLNRASGDRRYQSSMVSRTRSVIVAEGSSRANMTVLSKPSGPVISTRTPPRKGSAAIQPSYG